MVSQAFPHLTPHTPAGWVRAPIFLGVPHPKSPGFSTPRHGVVSGWFPRAVNSFSVTHDKFRDEVRARPEPGSRLKKGRFIPCLVPAPQSWPLRPSPPSGPWSQSDYLLLHVLAQAQQTQCVGPELNCAAPGPDLSLGGVTSPRAARAPPGSTDAPATSGERPGETCSCAGRCAGQPGAKEVMSAPPREPPPHLLGPDPPTPHLLGPEPPTPHQAQENLLCLLQSVGVRGGVFF